MGLRWQKKQDNIIHIDNNSKGNNDVVLSTLLKISSDICFLKADIKFIKQRLEKLEFKVKKNEI